MIHDQDDPFCECEYCRYQRMHPDDTMIKYGSSLGRLVFIGTLAIIAAAAIGRLIIALGE